MCDPGPVRSALLTARVLFFGALGFIAAAGIAAISIGGAPAAVYLAATAAVLFFAAGVALGNIQRPLDTFCNCAGEKCASVCATFKSNLATLMTLMAILTVAAIIAAATGLPWLAFALLALGASILIALTYFAKLDALLTSMKSCAGGGGPPPVPPPPWTPGPKPRPK